MNASDVTAFLAQFDWDLLYKIISVLGTVVAAIITAAAAWFTRAAVHEMREERIQRERPFIVIDFYVVENVLVHLRVRNLGRGVARSVSFTFDPVPEDRKGTKLTELPLFQRPIPFLAPGAEIGVAFYRTDDLLKASPDSARRFVIRADYMGPSGRRYSGSFPFDFELYEGTDLVTATFERNLKKLADAIERLQDEIATRFALDEHFRRPS